MIRFSHRRLRTSRLKQMELPIIGFGTWIDIVGGESPPMIESAVREALTVGYRHFDLSLVYHNQPFIEHAIIQSSIPRNEIYLTNKAHSIPNVKTARSLVSGFGYYDLFLLHSPPLLSQPEFGDRLLQEWSLANQLLNEGLVRGIGVSNFYQHQLEILLELCEKNNLHHPLINQLEIHPFNQEYSLVEFCKSQNIAVVAHSPLGGLGASYILQAPIIQKIANEIGSTPAQVVLASTMKRGIAVIPRSLNPTRIRENFESTNFIKSITIEHLESLRTLDAEFSLVELSVRAREIDKELSLKT